MHFIMKWLQAAGTLTWTQRGRILKDSCRGLAWLHGSKPPLIHQDVKSYAQYLLCMIITITTVSCDTVSTCTPRTNILLDRCFNARLGDFDFSVELPLRVVGDHTLLKARTFVCTEGYYPPELCEGLYSPKSDVYSYGVVSTFMNMNQDSYPMHTCVFL